MTKRTVLKGAMGAAFAVVAVLSTLSSPAQAASASDCDAGWVCIYENSNLSGSIATLAALGPKGSSSVDNFTPHKFHSGKYLNDQASSAINKTGHDVCFYEHTSWRGRRTTVPAGEWVNFAAQGWPIGDLQNDAASSVSWGAC
ncbi:peptidase inhibitor family I36 protein [Catellatospora citrea]|uniref:Peptidase inhibitor family I36 n=1 Tax=Catellatospora citrea TaxID=53366 RepID=A0A8J3KH20_9ACTN|nr:peptidase inhibitor family I36 protein [Catellatospora citrea]RKE10528.1 peptidase inhibitor family I36 [Catellatospora citrea]GIG03042.1 hypothetical protein Cci01nite_81350 [Catellatospora citrea]